MALLKRSTMALFSNPECIYDHRVRFALAEKAVTVDVYYVEADNKTLQELNTGGARPTLVDRDLIISHSNIILEYLDERFPHPPLFPVYPVMRAKIRMIIRQLEIDWYTPAIAIKNNENTEDNKKILLSHMEKLSPVFKKNNYFIGDDFSIVDCCIAPILWRLPEYGIELDGERHQDIKNYAEKIFNRTSFQGSLSNNEFKIRNEDEF